MRYVNNWERRRVNLSSDLFNKMPGKWYDTEQCQQTPPPDTVYYISKIQYKTPTWSAWSLLCQQGALWWSYRPAPACTDPGTRTGEVCEFKTKTMGAQVITKSTECKMAGYATWRLLTLTVIWPPVLGLALLQHVLLVQELRESDILFVQ